MKTNNIITRLSALILAGSIATLIASAADTTTTAENAVIAIPGSALPPPPAIVDAAKPAAATATKVKAKHFRKHHRAHQAATTAQTKTGRSKDGLVWFGAVAQNAQAKDVRLTKVIPGSPAYKAGLRAGDVIWKFDGQRLKTTAQLQRELREEKPGERVPVEIVRHGKRESINVKLGTSRTARALEHGSYVLIFSEWGGRSGRT